MTLVTSRYLFFLPQLLMTLWPGRVWDTREPVGFVQFDFVGSVEYVEISADESF
jgi:hypothetical protein